VAFVVLVVVTIALGVYVMLVGLTGPKPNHFNHLVRFWSWSFLRTAGVRCRVVGRDRVTQGESYVFISNHQSNLDVMAHFLAVPVPITFLAKKELFRIPVFSQAMRAFGIVKTDRQAGAGAHRGINRQVEKAIDLGYSVIIYPEGTRTRSGHLGTPKKGAFRIASQASLGVVPMAISGAADLWAPGRKLIRPGEIRIEMGEPIATDDGLDATRDEAWKFVQEAYQRLQAG